MEKERRVKISKKEADYRPGTRDKHCSTCVMYHSKSHTCDLVEGVIKPMDTCDYWEAKRD